MIEGALSADEVPVSQGTPAPGPAAAAGASPASPGVLGCEVDRGSGPSSSTPESPTVERNAELGADEEQPVPYPALAATVFFCLGQTTRPRSWCLRLVCNPYPSLAVGLRGPGVRDSLRVRPRAPRFVVPGWGWACGGRRTLSSRPSERGSLAALRGTVGCLSPHEWGVPGPEPLKTAESERVSARLPRAWRGEESSGRGGRNSLHTRGLGSEEFFLD
ncbi:uncharacterized protein LOC118499599 [Phyllostomus discolor]|uniref:Uncharacterized protein LOC118499599 n=1 Tax=Phyllostomus discolor TaxID=89673 RepID=A0A7E6DC72_9CHIR|nr:uncharacterized protein LOC118499599 [Phyllostomus discolor]